jgi:hypothetical protein
MSSVVAFMRATRGARACKFSGAVAVQLDLFFAASPLDGAGGECGLGSLRVTSPRSDAGRFLSFANATSALALGEQLLGLPAIEFIGALAFHRRSSISEAPLQASTPSGSLPAATLLQNTAGQVSGFLLQADEQPGAAAVG